eukprot:1285507-Rhodomonas_salina.2
MRTTCRRHRCTKVTVPGQAVAGGDLSGTSGVTVSHDALTKMSMGLYPRRVKRNWLTMTRLSKETGVHCFAQPPTSGMIMSSGNFDRRKWGISCQ